MILPAFDYWLPACQYEQITNPDQVCRKRLDLSNPAVVGKAEHIGIRVGLKINAPLITRHSYCPDHRLTCSRLLKSHKEVAVCHIPPTSHLKLKFKLQAC